MLVLHNGHILLFSIQYSTKKPENVHKKICTDNFKAEGITMLDAVLVKKCDNTVKMLYKMTKCLKLCDQNCSRHNGLPVAAPIAACPEKKNWMNGYGAFSVELQYWV